MKITNKYNLPETLIRAAKVRNANYASNADRSATQLINPPQIDILRKKYAHELERDVSEEFFALFGSAIHQILEWGAGNNTAEERLYANINGWVISGQIDLQYHDDKSASIVDYKFCSAYSLLKNGGAKPEWEQQLNIYAYLLWLNKGVVIRDISVCAIVRDWARREAVANLNYPQTMVTMVPLPLWSIEDQEAFIKDRVRLHQQAQFGFEIGEALPECSHEERWAAPDKWAVRPKGKKRSKTFSVESEAIEYGQSLGEFEIEHRPGKSRRCEFCGVAPWCEQFAKMKASIDIEEKETEREESV